MPRQESEGEVTQGKTECLSQSDQACPEPVEGFALSLSKGPPRGAISTRLGATKFWLPLSFTEDFSFGGREARIPEAV